MELNSETTNNIGKVNLQPGLAWLNITLERQLRIKIRAHFAQSHNAAFCDRSEESAYFDSKKDDQTCRNVCTCLVNCSGNGNNKTRRAKRGKF